MVVDLLVDQLPQVSFIQDDKVDGVSATTGIFRVLPY